MSSSGSITPSEAFGGKLLPDPEIDTLPGTLAVAHRFAGHGGRGLAAWLACACRPRRVAHRFAGHDGHDGHDGRDGRDWRHQRTGLERHYLSNGS